MTAVRPFICPRCGGLFGHGTVCKWCGVNQRQVDYEAEMMLDDGLELEEIQAYTEERP